MLGQNASETQNEAHRVSQLSMGSAGEVSEV